MRAVRHEKTCFHSFLALVTALLCSPTYNAKKIIIGVVGSSSSWGSQAAADLHKAKPLYNLTCGTSILYQQAKQILSAPQDSRRKIHCFKINFEARCIKDGIHLFSLLWRRDRGIGVVRIPMSLLEPPVVLGGRGQLSTCRALIVPPANKEQKTPMTAVKWINGLCRKQERLKTKNKHNSSERRGYLALGSGVSQNGTIKLTRLVCSTAVVCFPTSVRYTFTSYQLQLNSQLRCPSPSHSYCCHEPLLGEHPLELLDRLFGRRPKQAVTRIVVREQVDARPSGQGSQQ